MIIVKNRIFKYSFYDKNNYNKGSYLYLEGENYSKNNYNFFKINKSDNFLLQNNINYQVKISKIKLIKKGNVKLLNKLTNIYPEKFKNYLNLFLKQNDAENNLIKDGFKNIGILGIIIFSSFHLFLFKKIIFKILFFLNIRTLIKEIIFSIFLIFLTFIFKNNFLIKKMLITSIINFITIYTYKNITYENKLALNFIIASIIFPYAIYSFSYKIIYIYSFVKTLGFKKINNFHFILKDIINFYIFYLVCIPIFSLFKNEYSILIFLTGPLFYLYFKYLITPFFILSIFIYPLSFVAQKILIYNEYIIGNLSNVDINLLIPEFNSIAFLFYYLALVLTLIYKNKIIKILGINFLSLIFLINMFKFYLSPFKNVYFFNVGQGNFTLFKGKFGMDVTVVDFYGNALKRLKKMGIYKIDNLIITHKDKDHIGNIATDSNYIKINNVYLNDSDKYPKIKANNIKRLKTDYLLKLKNYDIYFYKAEDKTLEANNNSIVCKFYINNKSILMTGDIEKKAEDLYSEKYNSKLKSDILLSPHHGSDSSSTERFIKYVNPKEIIISCGKLNRFNFPKAKTTTLYNKLEIDYYITSNYDYILYSFLTNNYLKIFQT